MKKLRSFLSIIIPAFGLIFTNACSPYFHTIDAKNGGLSSAHLTEILNNDYPFSEHKGIEWSGISRELTETTQSGAVSDEGYNHLREVIYAIPDSRINISRKDDRRLRLSETSGYIGFDISYEPGGKYFVCRIDSQSEAWNKGIRAGYRLIGWNQKLISEAVDEYRLKWGFNPATEESERLLACHFLARGLAGSSVEVFYVNSQDNSKGVRIDYHKSERVDYPDFIGIPGHEEHKKFEYFNINDSLACLRLDQFTPSALRFFKKKVAGNLTNLKGIIIDMRESKGGYDRVASEIGSYFISRERLYEETFIRDGGDIRIIGSQITNPAHITFKGNVILLTGPLTMGVSEGFANLLGKEGNVKTLGCWNTAASYSLPGGRIRLGNGIKLYYPIGGAMDENHNIILESGKFYQGIKPDIRINATEEVIIQLANGYDALLEEAKAHIWIIDQLTN